MSQTLTILDSIRQRLWDKTQSFSVELFPDDLAHYHLTDEYGAILVQYAGSEFDSLDSSDIIQQRRKIQVALTVIARSQHQDNGALAVLDQIRLAIVGFKPTHCTPCHLISEAFAGEEDGLWQYQLMIQTETWQVEQVEKKDLAKLTSVIIRQQT